MKPDPIVIRGILHWSHQLPSFICSSCTTLPLHPSSIVDHSFPRSLNLSKPLIGRIAPMSGLVNHGSAAGRREITSSLPGASGGDCECARAFTQQRTLGSVWVSR